MYRLDCRLPVDSGFTTLEMLRDRGLGGASNIDMISAVNTRELASAAHLGRCHCFNEKSGLSSKTSQQVLDGTRVCATYTYGKNHPVTLQGATRCVSFACKRPGVQHRSFAMRADGIVLRLDDGH